MTNMNDRSTAVRVKAVIPTSSATVRSSRARADPPRRASERPGCSSAGRGIRRGKDFVQLTGGPFDIDRVFALDGIESCEESLPRLLEVRG